MSSPGPPPEPPLVLAAAHVEPEDGVRLVAAAAAAGMTVGAFLDSAFAAALARILHAADLESAPRAADRPPRGRQPRKYLNARRRAP